MLFLFHLVSKKTMGIGIQLGFWNILLDSMGIQLIGILVVRNSIGNMLHAANFVEMVHSYGKCGARLCTHSCRKAKTTEKHFEAEKCFKKVFLKLCIVVFARQVTSELT